jgi:solute carrier family 25 (mitochondrial aspartate/glutamate transporter), member 12/13
MEASIIFHFAGRGSSQQRLALIDFAQLLDPRWQAPAEETTAKAPSTAKSILNEIGHSAYNFGLGGKWEMIQVSDRADRSLGIAGAFGATMVYPIDLGEHS